MDKFRNYVFAVAGFVILASAFTVIGPYVDQGQADPPVKNVNVVNIPLPVTGVLVGDVLVTNTAAEPVPVEVQPRTLDIVAYTPKHLAEKILTSKKKPLASSAKFAISKSHLE